MNETSKSSELDQKAMDRRLIDEIRSEKKWEKALAESEDVLSRLAGKAIEEHSRGKTKLLDTQKIPGCKRKV